MSINRNSRVLPVWRSAFLRDQVVVARLGCMHRVTFLLVMMWLVVGDVRFASAATPEEVILAWKQREQAAETFRFAGHVEEVVPARSRPPSPFAKSPGQEAMPARDVLLRRQFRYLVKDDMAHYHEQGEFWKQIPGEVRTRTYSTNIDGSIVNQLFNEDDPDAIYPFGVIHYDGSATLVTGKSDISAVTLVYRPLSQFLPSFGASSSALRTGEPQSTPPPSGVASVTFGPSSHPHIVIYVWTDAARGHLPVRWLREQSGKLVHDEAIEYRQEGGGWVPSSWRTQSFKRGKLLGFCDVTVAESAVNIPLDDRHFAIEFPYGTWVNEIRGKEERTFLVQDNGRRRYLAEDELDIKNYEQLMQPTSPPYGFAVLCVVIVALVCLVVVYRRQRKRASHQSP